MTDRHDLVGDDEFTLPTHLALTLKWAVETMRNMLLDDQNEEPEAFDEGWKAKLADVDALVEELEWVS